MKLRVLVLALASVAAPSTAVAADDICSRLILQAVQQFCQLLPSGLNLCQPVAVMGPGPECKSPEKQALVRVPLAAPTLQFPYGAPPPAASFSYSPPPYTTPVLLPPVAAVVPRVDPGSVLPAAAPVVAVAPAPAGENQGQAEPATQAPVMEMPVKQDAVPAESVDQVVADAPPTSPTPPAITEEVMPKPETAPAAPAPQTVAEVAQVVETPPAAAAEVSAKPEAVPATPAAQAVAEVVQLVQIPSAIPAEVMARPEADPATPATQFVTEPAQLAQTPSALPAEVMAEPEAAPAVAPTADAAAPALTMPAVTPSVMVTEAPGVDATPAPDVPPAAAPAVVVTTVAGADQAAPAIPSAEAPAVPVAPVQAAAPVAAPVPAAVQPQVSVSTQDIDALAHFDFDSAELTEAGRTALDAWVALAPGGKTVRITGYADRLGPEPYNLKLSLRRAQTVKEYLAGKGVNGRVVQLEARGEADPVIRCKGGSNPVTKACLAPNRRAQVELE